MIWLIRNIILALHSEKNRWQLALGAALGWFLGMIPWDNAVWGTLLLLTLLLRCNLGLVVVFGLFGKMLTLPLDTTWLGLTLLHHESLSATWTQLYNTPYVHLSGFNRAEVMGGFAFASALTVLTFPLLIQIAKLYQRYILAFLERFWVVKALKGSRFFQWYMRIVG